MDFLREQNVKCERMQKCRFVNIGMVFFFSFVETTDLNISVQGQNFPYLQRVIWSRVVVSNTSSSRPQAFRRNGKSTSYTSDYHVSFNRIFFPPPGQKMNFI